MQNSELIPQKELDNITKATELIPKLQKEVTNLIDPYSKWVVELSKGNLSLKEQISLIDKINKAEKDYVSLSSEIAKAQEQIVKEKAKLIVQESEEAKAIQRKKIELQLEAKAVREAAKAEAEATKEAERRNKVREESIKWEKEVQEEASVSSRSWSQLSKEEQDAIMGRSSATKGYAESIEDVVVGTDRATESTQQLTGIQKEAEKSYAKLGEFEQKEITYLLELQEQHQNIKKSLRDLDKEYARGLISQEKYVKDKARLIALEREQVDIIDEVSHSVRGASTDITKYDDSLLTLTRSIGLYDRQTGATLRKVQNVPVVKKAWLNVNNQLVKSLGLSAKAASVLQMAIVGMVIGGIILAISKFKEFRDEQKKLQKSTEELLRPIGEEIAKLDTLFLRLRSAKEGTAEYAKTRKEIQDNYGKHLDNLSEEERLLKNQEGAYKALTAAVIENAAAKGMADANAKAFEEFGKSVSDALGGVDQLFVEKFGKEQGAALFREYTTGIIQGGGKLNKELYNIYKEFNTEIQSIGVDGRVLVQQFNPLKTKMWEIKDASDELNSSVDHSNLIFGAFMKTIQKTNAETESLVSIQEEELRKVRLWSESTEAEIKAKNRKIKTIETEISRLKSLGVESNKTIKDAMKLAVAEVKALDEINQLKIDNNATALKKISDDNRTSYDERISAFNAFQQEMENSIRTKATNEEDNLVRPFLEAGMSREQAEKKVWNQILLIRAKAETELNKIAEDGWQTRLSITEQYLAKEIDTITKEAEKRNNEIDRLESEALVSLAERFKDGTMKQEEYEQERLEITRKYAKQRFEADISVLNESLRLAEEQITANEGNEEILAELTEKRAEVQRQIEKATLDYDIYLNGLRVEDDKKAGDKRIEIEKAVADKRKELLKGVADFASAIFKRSVNDQLKEIEKLSQANTEYYDEEKERIDRLYEAGAISKEEADARKRFADDEEQAREEELAQKRAEVMRRQFMVEQTAAVLSIAKDAAEAVFKIKAQAAILASNPLTKALAAVALAQIPKVYANAGIQTGIILAQDLPQYAEGTMDSGERGLRIVGDGGKHEMILSGGNIFKTPKTDTIIDLPAHSMVLPDFNAALQAMAVNAMVQAPQKGVDMGATHDILRKQGHDIHLMKLKNDESVRIAKQFMVQQAKSANSQKSNNVVISRRTFKIK